MSIKSELSKLLIIEHTDKKVIMDCLQRLDENPNLIRDSNPIDHFCSFFVPLNLVSKSIFMGHHIKANAWTPPGGHIDKGETPIETVKREFWEELKYRPDDKHIKLFDITKLQINNPQLPCKVHRDFWYLVFTDKLEFKFDAREFHETAWLPIKEASKLNKFQEFEGVYKALVIKYG